MKNILICYFALSLICLLASCQADYNNSKKYPIEHKHSYSETHSHGHDEYHAPKSSPEIGTDNFDNIKNRYSSSDRSKWQKPYLAISMFGDLAGKTIADIGAGPEGYFTLYFAGGTNASKILAVDIDQEALNFINEAKKGLGEAEENRIETRLAEPDDAKLEENEVDDILISETLVYIDNPVEYLSNLHKSLKKGGKLLIIDFKMKKIPSIFPQVEQRIPLYKMENVVEEAGFRRLISDDTSLPFHYMILCENP